MSSKLTPQRTNPEEKRREEKRREEKLKIAIEVSNMARTLSLVAKNGSGYGLPDGRCFPFSGISGKAVTATFCLSRGDLVLPLVKIGTLSWAPRGGALFVCKATGSGSKKNPGASKKSKSGLSQGKTRKNNEEGNADLEMNEELELDFSKNGSFDSVSSNNSSPEATATPGRKEKEIAELFKKVQVQLREKAASRKGEKKVENVVKEEESNNKSSDTIGPLLQLLRKHSAEKGKGSSVGDILAEDKPAENGAVSLGMETYPFKNTKDVEKASHGSTASRSPSKFTKKSPVPQEKPNSSSGENFGQLVSRWTSSTSSDTRKKHQGGISAEPEEVPDMESESESDSESEANSGYSPVVKARWTPKDTKKINKTILTDILPELEDDPEFDSILDSESDSETELDPVPKPAAPKLKTEAVYSFSSEDAYDETVNAAVEEVDLSGLKVVELRELAKTRGLKGASKMKKSDLIELLSSSV